MPLTNPSVPIQEDWEAPTLTNSWSNATGTPTLTPAGYYKDSLGVVHLRGSLTGGAVGTTLFTLPSGYRPEFRHQIGIATRDSSSVIFGKVDVYADGSVQLGAGGTTRVFLDGVSFRAA